jgi:hypothetical protein
MCKKNFIIDYFFYVRDQYLNRVLRPPEAGGEQYIPSRNPWHEYYQAYSRPALFT